ncbi:MAG: hypothetical protein R3E32_29510 [Chitinophagales bacterium]
MALTSIIRFGVGITWKVVSRIIFFTFLGVVINWVLFFMLPDMCDLQQSQQGGMIAYFQELISHCFLAFAIGVSFLVLFPIAYIFLSYKQSLQSAIYYVYVKNKETFYKYISDRMLSFVEKKKTGDKSVVQLAGNFLEKLDNVPFVMRWIIGFLKDKIPFVEVLEKMNVDVEITPENSEAVAMRLAHDADQYIEDELLKPDLTLVWLLIGINIGVFALVKWIA